MGLKTSWKHLILIVWLVSVPPLTQALHAENTPVTQNLCRMIRLMNAGFAHEGEWPYDTFDELLKALSEKAHYEASNSNFQTTIDDLNCLIMWRPFPDNYMLRGQMHLALYQWDQAIADLDMAISHKPDYAPFYFQRGIIYYSILQTGIETRPAALADFEQYLTLDPTGPYAEQAQDHIDAIQEAIGLLQQ